MPVVSPPPFALPNLSVRPPRKARFAYPQLRACAPLAPYRSALQFTSVGRAVLNQKQTRCESYGSDRTLTHRDGKCAGAPSLNELRDCIQLCHGRRLLHTQSVDRRLSLSHGHPFGFWNVIRGLGGPDRRCWSAPSSRTVQLLLHSLSLVYRHHAFWRRWTLARKLWGLTALNQW
jgi:hypothetical protein